MVSARSHMATYDDYLALPEGTKAELIDGVLYMCPQPKSRHLYFTSQIGARLNVAFGRASGSGDRPGGWWILDEPECHLWTDRRVVIPDLAGWRRERLPRLSADDHKFTVAPDWVCEVLSPSTSFHDNIVKMPRYYAAGIPWAWLVDPVARRIDVLSSGPSEWLKIGSFEGDMVARIPPFDAIELDLSEAWLAP